MLRVIAVVAIVIVTVSGDPMKKCHRLGHPGTLQCCKTELPMPNMKPEEFKECMELPHKPGSCDHDICMAKKFGYASDDGTIDNEALEKHVQEDFKDYPSLIEAHKENCINGDLNLYGPPDACDLVKMRVCFQMQLVNECKEWDDNGPCVGIKDLVKECKTL